MRVLALAVCGAAAGLVAYYHRAAAKRAPDAYQRGSQGLPDTVERPQSPQPRPALPYSPRLEAVAPSFPGGAARPIVDTTLNVPPVAEQTRDDSWAKPMEAVVTAHARKNLADFLPDATWRSGTCMTTTCVLEFTFADVDAEFAAIIAPFIAGPFTRSRDLESDGDGRSTMRITVSYLDRNTGDRIDPSAFGKALDSLPPRYVEWRERIRNNVAAAKAEVSAAASGQAP